MTTPKIRDTSLALLIATGVTCALPVAAQELYAGKTVNIIVGSDVAGGYDTYARLFSRHLGDHLPGKPNTVV